MRTSVNRHDFQLEVRCQTRALQHKHQILGEKLSDVVYTVLVSPATKAPWGDRAFAPIEVATLYVGGSANWVFTSLRGRSENLSVRPSGPESEAAALLVGLAAGVGGDDSIRLALEARPMVNGAPSAIDLSADQELIQTARESLAGRLRLSFAGDELFREGRNQPQVLGDLEDFDVEVLVPSEA